MAGRDPPRPLQVTVKHAARKPVQGRFLRKALHLHIPESIIGKMGLYISGISIGDISKLRLRGTQIAAIEIAVLQHFAKLHINPGTLGLIRIEPQETSHILPHIDDRLTGRCMNNPNRTELFLDHHRLSVSRRKTLRRTIQKLHPVTGRRIRAGCIDLTVINIAGHHTACFRLPGLVRDDLIFASLSVLHHQFQYHLVPVAVIILRMVKAKSSHIPSVRQRYLQPVGAPLNLHFIRLVLDPLIIIRTSRRQILISYPFPVQIHLIQPQTRNIDSGTLIILLSCKFLHQHRISALWSTGTDPFAFPGFLHFSRLKPRCITYRILSVIAPDLRFPVISGARLWCNLQICPNHLNPGRSPGIIDNFFEIFIQRRHDPDSLRLLRLRVRHLKRYSGFLNLISQRICQVICL